MHSVIKNAVLLPFLFILVESLGLGLQSSSGGSNETAMNTTTNAAGNLTGERRLLRELVNQSALSGNVTIDELLRNLDEPVPPVNLSGPAPSDLPGVGNPLEYQVKVTFDSITVPDDHDHDSFLTSPFGTTSGGGEFWLYAYVQGKQVSLTQAFPQGTGLWSIDSGTTRQFPPGVEVTVSYHQNELKPLSIMTVGYEDDTGACQNWAGPVPIPGAGFHAPWWFPDYIPAIPSVFNLPNDILPWIPAISRIQDGLDEYVEQQNDEFGCDDHDDILGRTNNIYMPPGQSYEPVGWGAGSHTHVVSNTGDYILRYTISITPPAVGPILDPEQCASNVIPFRNVTSSGNLNTFPPTNAIDDNPNTKWWSTHIPNPSITLALTGLPPRVCGVDIAWADGNQHPYSFVISVSNDGTNFVNVLSGSSTGTTTGPEKYDFPNTVEARFVKITITQSTPGSPNSIAQISEINAFGTIGFIPLPN